MDALQDLLAALVSLSYLELMLGLLITGAVILVLGDWRMNLWALMAQFVLVGVLLARVIPLRVALIKVIIGSMACVILYLTARRVHWGKETVDNNQHGRPSPTGGDAFSMNLWFRVLVALLAAVVSYALGSTHPFVDQPPGISEACYWLVSVGLLIVVLARDPFKVGLGLLTFQAGFGILLATFEKSLSVAALLGMVNLLIALAVAYLTATQTTFPAEGDEA
jgi:hypothetical protein